MKIHFHDKENRQHGWLILGALANIVDSLVCLLTLGFFFSNFHLDVLTARIRRRTSRRLRVQISASKDKFKKVESNRARALKVTRRPDQCPDNRPFEWSSKPNHHKGPRPPEPNGW